MKFKEGDFVVTTSEIVGLFKVVGVDVDRIHVGKIYPINTTTFTLDACDVELFNPNSTKHNIMYQNALGEIDITMANLKIRESMFHELYKQSNKSKFKINTQCIYNHNIWTITEVMGNSVRIESNEANCSMIVYEQNYDRINHDKSTVLSYLNNKIAIYDMELKKQDNDILIKRNSRNHLNNIRYHMEGK